MSNPPSSERPSAPPEAWLRGPLSGVEPLLMPAAQALVQATEDIERVVADTQRHVGQLIATAQAVRAPGGAGGR